MTDYRHELQFGIFPSPDADQAPRTVELAKLADVSGLDLVTVQDHPYQAKHLDAWTLLSVIAAQTSAVRVALNVANLPLRSPVVLARSVATLDRLSGGESSSASAPARSGTQSSRQAGDDSPLGSRSTP